MTHSFGKSFTILSLLTCLDLGCDESAGANSSQNGSFRTNNGGGQTLSSGGGMWINNMFYHPEHSGLDTAFALASSQGLATGHGLLLDPSTRAAVRSVVECALPAGHSIVKEVNGEVLQFEGMLGLAPEWEDDACDEDCQEWVSACLLARTNASDHAVSIWMRADHPAIGEGTSALYPTYEASFFGNVFTETPEMHYCQGTSEATLTQLEGRTCADESDESCGIVKHTACQARLRCTFSKGGDSPKNCVDGMVVNGHSYHTITTYVGPS